MSAMVCSVARHGRQSAKIQLLTKSLSPIQSRPIGSGKRKHSVKVGHLFLCLFFFVLIGFSHFCLKIPFFRNGDSGKIKHLSLAPLLAEAMTRLVDSKSTRALTRL
jgi:hypothetical protein